MARIDCPTPIENIRRAAERITAERLDERIPSEGPADEIGGLINVLNATFARLQGSFEQAARFSADASHQLKTPIAILRAGIDEILTRPGLSEEHREAVAELLQQTRRLTSVAENLLLLSRADTGRLALRATEFDLGKLLQGSLEDARVLGAVSKLQIEANIPKTLPMNGDREMISLTVQNLIENAVKYNRPAGKVLVSAEKHDHVMQICVGNNGPGIPGTGATHIRAFLPCARRRTNSGTRFGVEYRARTGTRPWRRPYSCHIATGLDGILFATVRLKCSASGGTARVLYFQLLRWVRGRTISPLKWFPRICVD